MGERERRGTDLRAVRNGLVRAVVVTLALYGTGLVAGLVFNPVLRDLAGGLRVPHGLALGIPAAVLGLGAGWARVRATRRYVAPGSAGTIAGSRALAIAVANSRSADGAHRRGRRVQADGAVRRWDSDLLSWGPDVEDQAVTGHAADAAADTMVVIPGEVVNDG